MEAKITEPKEGAPPSGEARRRTEWRPRLSADGPRYRALADAIAEAIDAGELCAGDRLPPVRDLAWTLKVTPGTIARAYQLAENRGLLEGRVGRGTFVKASRAGASSPAAASFLDAQAAPPGAAIAKEPSWPSGKLDLCTNRAIDVGQDSIITARLQELIAELGTLPLTPYHCYGEDEAERRSVARWLASGGLPERDEDTLICSGAEHALLVALSATSGGGDAVALTEPLIYPGLKDCARAMGVRLEPVATDPDLGVDPEALEAAAARYRPSAIILNTNFQNPTLVTLSLERRKAVAEIARRRRIPIIEDDVYGWTSPSRLPSFPNFAPELCWYVTSFSKCVAAGLRAGFLLCPPGAGPVTARLLRGHTQHVPWLTSALATALIDSGDAKNIAEAVRKKNAQRAEWLERSLGPALNNRGGRLRVSAENSMAWLELPDPWRAVDFEAAALEAGVLVTAAEQFAVGRTHAPHAVRIAHGACDQKQLEEGVARIAELIASGPGPGALHS